MLHLEKFYFFAKSGCYKCPPGHPPLTSSSTSVVDAAGPIGSTPRAPAIDVISNLGGGRCRTHRKRPQGPHHRRSLQNLVVDAVGPTDSAPQEAHHQCHLQPRWWTLPNPPIMPLGAHHRCLTATGSRCQYPLPTPPRGPLVDYHYWVCYKQDISQEKFSILAMLRTQRRKPVKKISSNVTKAMFIYKTKNVGTAGRGRESYASSAWRSNRSATTFTPSRTSTCATFEICSAGPCTTSSSEPGGLGCGGITACASQPPLLGCGPLPPAGWR
jgi:hypothetical protein